VSLSPPPASPGPAGGPDPGRLPQAVLLLSGIQAAGKSTVGELLAGSLPRSVHLRGDLFRKMIVGGRADMTPEAGEEAARQLRLRHRLTATVADTYFAAGFTVIAQDIIIGEHLIEMVAAIRSRPLLVVMLVARPDVIAAREAGRAKNAYGAWSVAQLDEALRRTTLPLGLWLDTSDQSPAETAAQILACAWTQASVD
jgi:chloramphenicol 3-O-phosphotransferase